MSFQIHMHKIFGFTKLVLYCTRGFIICCLYFSTTYYKNVLIKDFLQHHFISLFYNRNNVSLQRCTKRNLISALVQDISWLFLNVPYNNHWHYEQGSQIIFAYIHAYLLSINSQMQNQWVKLMHNLQTAVQKSQINLYSCQQCLRAYVSWCI